MNSISKVIELFNSAFVQKDASLLSNLVAEDCVMEGAFPPPDGLRVAGGKACREFWEALINTPDTQFSPETVTILDNRAIIQWRFEWGATEKKYVRGVNLMAVNEGMITEALGYVKGSLAE